MKITKKCKKCGKKFETHSFLMRDRCDKHYKKPKMTSGHKVIDKPLKGSKRWYKEKWFRKSDKEWKRDIKSRKRMPDGSVGRFNRSGERIG